MRRVRVPRLHCALLGLLPLMRAQPMAAHVGNSSPKWKTAECKPAGRRLEPNDRLP